MNETYNFLAIPTLNKKLVIELACGEWIGLDGPPLFRLEAWGAGVLSDQRERPRRGITPGPLPDGESGEVQEGEHPPMFGYSISCRRRSLRKFWEP